MSDTPNVDGLWLAEESVFKEHHAPAVNGPAMSRILKLINGSLVFMLDIADDPYDTRMCEPCQVSLVGFSTALPEP